jgi:hypothetical protein
LPEAITDGFAGRGLELWMGDRCNGLDELPDYYLQRVLQLWILEPGAQWLTDKMTLNETHLG